MAGMSPKLPLTLGDKHGYTLIENIKDLAIQNFLMLLLTNQGERIMDASFGVGIRKILFENFNSSYVSDFESRLQQQITKYTPYIKILNIDYSDSKEEIGLLSIKIKAYIIPLGETKNITITKNGSFVSNTEPNF